MPAGRPTVYDIDQIRKVYDEYLTECEMGNKLPSVSGLAILLKVARKTIYEWAKEEGKEEFCDILEDLLAKQEETLVNKGLRGEYNSTISKLILTKHGYSDKVETDNTHHGNVSVTLGFVPVESSEERPDHNAGSEED